MRMDDEEQTFYNVIINFKYCKFLDVPLKG